MGNGRWEDEAAVGLRDALARRAAELLRQRRRVRRGRAAGAVHDLRVASRRFQEAVAVWEPYLPAAARSRAARRAGRIRRALGEARDAEVARDLLLRLAPRLPAAHRGAARRLADALQAPAGDADRAAGHGVPLPGIRKRIAALLKAIPEGSGPPIDARLRAVIGSRLEEIVRRLPRARMGNLEAMHRLRIAIKRYRYTLEILEEAGDARADAAIAEARSLQRRLGRLRDLQTLLEFLRRRTLAGAERLRAHLDGVRRQKLADAAATLRRFDPAARWRVLFPAPAPPPRAPRAPRAPTQRAEARA